MMTEAQRKMKKYTTSIERKLDLPREAKARVMNDFITTIAAMREAGKTDEEIYAELGTPKKVAADLNEQMKEFAYRKSPWRFVFLAVAVLAGLWLGLCRLMIWLGSLMEHISISIHSAAEDASVGIIGGADGPTAIFVSTPLVERSGFDWDLLLVLAVLLACVYGFLRLRKCKPKK